MTVNKLRPRTCGSGNPGQPATPLAARLKALRQQTGMTQAGFAAAIAAYPNRICDWELGIHEPSLKTLKRYADYFQTTVSQLLDGIM